MNTAVGTLSLLQGNLPDPGIKLGSSAMQMDSLPAELSGKPFPGLAGPEITRLTASLRPWELRGC